MLKHTIQVGMSTRETLLAEINAYLAKHRMSPTAFSVAATGDRTFVRTLAAGRDPKSDTIDRVRAFLARPTKPQRRSESRDAA